MRFSVAAATALLSTAFAVPATSQAASTENIDFNEFSVRKSFTDGTPLSAYFKISGDDATDLVCSVENPKVASDEVYTCGESKYRWALTSAQDDEGNWGIRVYHELGTAFGRTGEGKIFTYCHSGGGDVMICEQQNENTIVITSA